MDERPSDVAPETMQRGTAVPLTFVPGRAATTLAFASPGWAAVTRVRGLASALYDAPTLLGEPDRTSSDAAPLIFSIQTGVGVVHRSPDGVFVTTLGAARGAVAALSRPVVPALFGPGGDAREHPPGRPAQELLSSARALALAPRRHGTDVVAWDGRRVYVLRIDERGVAPEAAAVWLDRAGKSAHLAAARIGAHTVAAIAFDDEPALHVLSLADARPRVVRHALASPVAGLSMAGAGNRAGCAIVLEGGDRVEVAELDASGRFVDRPVTRVEGRGTRWDAPVVVHVEDGFAVLLRDALRRTAALHRFAGRGALVTLDRVDAPPAAAWHEKRLWVASATCTVGDDSVSVLVHRASLEKNEATLVTPLAITPPPALGTRRAEERALRTLLAAATELTTTTYRGTITGDAPLAQVDRDAATLTVGSVRATIEVDGTAPRLVVVVREPGSVADPESLDSFARLAGWVRRRLSAKAWETALSEARWIDSLAAELGGTAEAVPTRSGVRLIVTLAALPTGDVLARWLRRVRAEVHDRALVRDSAGPG